MYQLREYPIMSENNEYTLITVASGVVLMRDKKVLLVRESDEDFYSFPGGTCRNNESPEQTAVREVQEEVGLSVTISSNPFIFQLHRPMGAHTELILLYQFSVDSVVGRIQLGNDAKEMTWKSIHDDFSDCFPNVEYVATYYINQFGHNPGYKLI